MSERPDHLTLTEGLPSILGMANDNSPVALSSSESVLKMHTQGERETRTLITTIYGTYLDIYAISGYLSKLVAEGELRAAHHFLLLLYVVCRSSLPLALVEAVRCDVLLRAYVAGAISGIRLEVQILNEKYSIQMEEANEQ